MRHETRSKQHALIVGELAKTSLEDLMSDDYQLAVGNYNNGRFGNKFFRFFLLLHAFNKSFIFPNERGDNDITTFGIL